MVQNGDLIAGQRGSSNWEGRDDSEISGDHTANAIEAIDRANISG
jgi:hypothetical protein